MSGFAPHGVLAHGVLPAADATPTSLATLRWSTHGYTSTPSDSPASTHYEGRVIGDVTFEQSFPIAGGPFGRAAIGFGEIALWDGDGDLSSLLYGYAIDGRALRLKVADGTGKGIGTWPALSSFVTIFGGTGAGWRRDAKTVRVRLRDIVARLDVPVQVDFYGGSGGLDGPAQLKGMPKPQTWGQAFNVAPIYLGVMNLGYGDLATFQVHYRAISDVLVVRERGAAMTKVVGTTPVLGEFVVIPASGVFQLGFTPDGAITADVAGDAQSWYAFTPGKLAQRIAADICGLVDAEFDQPSFDDYDYFRPGTVGLYLGADQRARAIDVIEALIGGTGGFVTQTRAGLMRVGVLAEPELAAHAILDVAMIRDVIPADLPDAINPPPERVEVGFARNYAPSEDLAGAVTGDERTYLTQVWRTAASYDGDVDAAHALAQQLPLFGSVFADEAPAQRLSDDFLSLYRPGRQRFRVITDRYLGTLELGWTVEISYPLFGLAGGWRGVIEGIREDWLSGTVELMLFG